MMDYKTRVLQGRKGIYEGFHMEEVEVKDASNFPGFVISTSVGGFVIVVLFVTIMFTFISWPLFWLYLWSIWLVLLSFLIPEYINKVIEGYVQDYIYDDYYIKRRWLAGLMDTFYFFLAILAGLAEALKRFYISLFGLLVCQCRINQACLPTWILNIKYLDEFHKTFMCYVYMQSVHNNPIVTSICHDLV